VTSRGEHEDSRAEKILVVVGIIVLAFNLRPAAVSVGPVLDELTGTLGMSATVAGVLTTLPVLAFAGVGALAPTLARMAGAHRVTLVSLIAVVVGLGLRAETSSIPLFLLLSLVALSGMATANVLLPSLVKLHFPNQIGLMTAVYSTALAIGLTSASVLTVPVLSVGIGDGAGVGVSSDPHPLIVMVTPANIARALWTLNSRLVKEFSWLIASS